MRAVDRGKRRFFGLSFDPSRKMFQITVELKDVPGALADVLQALRGHIDVAGCVAYSTGNGKAVFSGFARALDKQVTEGSLKTLLVNSGAVQDVWVSESQDGLLVDSFHTGIESDFGENYILMPINGMSQTYERLIDILGSGGESILYDEGVSSGKVNAQYFVERLGVGLVREKLGQILMLYGALGWGNPEVKQEGYGAEFTIRVINCFECSSGHSSREYCSFQRGHLTGLISGIFDTSFEATETRCRFRRDPYCEFKLTQKPGPRLAA